MNVQIVVRELMTVRAVHEAPSQQRSRPEGCDAKVKVLSEHVKHLVQEERGVMFPKARASSFVMVDMIGLGARMAARRDELLAQAA